MDLYNKIMYVQHEPIVIEAVEYEHKGPTNTPNSAATSADNGTAGTNGPYKSRTKSDLLDQVFAECKQAQNIKELLASSSAVLNKLNVLDLHQSAQVLLLPARGEQRLPEGGVSLDSLAQRGTVTQHGQGPLRCRLLVQLVEHKPLTLRAATTHTTGVGETSLEFSATHRNLFGRAERGHVTAVITASQSSVLQASLARPVLIGPTFAGVAELQVGQSLTHSPLSSHRELKRDLVARWRYMRHELAYEWAWRHVTLLPGATERMLSEGGDSVKSALKHRYMIAQLDDLLTPTRGFALRFVQELAGLGGDVKFLKHELDVNYNVPLAVKGMALNFLFKAGTHVPLFDSKSYVADRFFLGGATIFRAFANKGVGPRFRRDSYGGDVMYNASAYLSGPLPLPKSSIGEFRGHVFGHVGSLISINRKKGLKDHIETLVEQYRASVGVGVVLKTVFGARVELNYAVPLKYSASDRVQSLQLGIAFDFL